MKYLAVLCLLWLSAAPAPAAPPGASPHSAPSPSIRPGDTLEIGVAGEASLSKNYTVDAAGNVSMEMAGRVPVSGRTCEQLAAELQSRLRAFLKEPTVTVSLITPPRQEILVTGEVLRPGAVKLRPGDGLLDALAAVGGLGPNADPAAATLVRRGQNAPQSLKIDLLLKGDLSQNAPLNDGDILQIPRKEVTGYQIVGEVKQPGSRALEGSPTVLDALLAAGGLTDRADRNRVTLTRKNQSQPIPIDLDQMLAGETQANVTLQPGDVLAVAARMAVQVVGEVRAPGERLLRNSGTLMEAILLAGGFTPDADRVAIQVTHRDGKTETFSLAEVTAVVGGPALQSGDLVLVGRGKAETVSITGAVRNPGMLRYQSGMKITDALMAVGGLLETAQWKQIRVLRADGASARKVFVFNLEAYLKAPQAENLVLQAGDQIYVTSGRKTGGKSLIKRLMEVMPLAGLFF